MNINILSLEVVPYENEYHLKLVYLKDGVKHKISSVL